ncbi:ORF73-like protein [Bufonid herpesvirus 1]|uniref:ORF73-like protein n=1 Tax=Bufonid herpesvirus 1 TaxID=2282206 RepID=UPI000EB7112E|nr:ORF73-like protein [Bufonid herpesvirus 1]AXF48559.1 ORF73-like protein [Bufonid herpesvirus 1]
MLRLPLQRTSFQINPFEFSEPATVYFLSFEKAELTDGGQELHLCNVAEGKRDLFETLLYLTYVGGGKVLTTHHEPHILDCQSNCLTPFLRYELSSGVTFLFVVYNSIGGADPTSSLNTPTMDDYTEETRVFVSRLLATSESVVQTNTATLLKKLICYKLGLCCFRRLMLKAGCATDMTNLFPNVAWFRNRILASIKPKDVRDYGGVMGNSEDRAHGPTWVFLSDGYGIESLNRSANSYFDRKASENSSTQERECTDMSDDTDATAALGAILSQFSVDNIMSCPILKAHRELNPGSPVSQWLRQFSGTRNLSKIDFSAHQLAFMYDTQHLFTPTNPVKYKTCYLYRYPRLQNPDSANLEDWISVLTTKHNLFGDPEHDNCDPLSGKRLIFPQFANLMDMLGVVPNRESGHALLYKTLINSAATTFSQAAPLYKAMARRLLAHGGPAEAFTLKRFAARPPREIFTELMTDFFIKHFGLSRIKQAVSTFLYVIANTSIRWTTSRPMIINCAAPGVGKSFINTLLKTFFAEADLIRSINRFTPTSFTHTLEAQSGITVIIDDAGFNESTLKQASNENSNVASTFKNLLDNGYMETTAPVRKGKDLGFVTVKHKPVHNVGFVWNSNSFSLFTDAMMDRAIVFGDECSSKKANEPSVAFYSASDAMITDTCHKMGLCESAMKCLLRQNLFQTAAGLLSPTSLNVKPQYDIVVAAAKELYSKRYPCSTQCASDTHRVTTTLHHLAFQSASFLACAFVWDSWIPPWCNSQGNIETERIKALGALGLREMVAECVAVYHLCFADSIIENMHLVFGQSIAPALKTAKEVLTHAFIRTGGSCEQVSNGVLRLEMPDPPFSLSHINCKPALAKLRKLRIPVFSVKGSIRKEDMYREIKSAQSPGTSRLYHTMTLSAESLLSQVCLFWNDDVLSLWIKMAELCGLERLHTETVTIEITPKTQLECAILRSVCEVTRLCITSNRTIGSSCDAVKITFNPRKSGIRTAYACKLLNEGVDAVEVELTLDKPSNTYPQQEEIDFLRERESGGWTVGLAQMTVSDSSTSDLQAAEFSTGFGGGLSIVKATSIACKIVYNKPPMHPVLPPTHKSKMTEDILKHTISYTAEGKVVLIPGWEYILAAREWLLYLFPTSELSDERVLHVAQTLKARYSNKPNTGSVLETYGYYPMLSIASEKTLVCPDILCPPVTKQVSQTIPRPDQRTHKEPQRQIQKRPPPEPVVPDISAKLTRMYETFFCERDEDME